jgi:hypothetical protein
MMGGGGRYDYNWNPVIIINKLYRAGDDEDNAPPPPVFSLDDI